MARSKRLEIVIAGDASGGIRALGSIEGRLGKAGRSFGRFGRAAALGLGAVAVAGAAAVVAVGRDLMNMERLNAQTETAIRSTGGAANVSARDIQDFSQAMQDLTGIQQETVIEGQNLLLTFTNVRNEAGRGNDVFTQASTAMADLSVAMGTDMSSAAMLVGKALNDPIRGMGSLSRAGVQFTEQQREQIATLMESGDVLGAQRIILGELQTQFGGSAAAFGETTAGQFARIKEGVMDAVESLVVRLMPAITQAAAWFRTTAMPAVQQFAEQVGPRLTEAFNTVVAWVRANWPQIQTTITNVMTQVRSVISSVTDFIRTAWAAFGDDILGHVRRAWPIVQQAIRGAMQVIKGVIQTVSALIKGDWGQVWNGIVNILKGAWNLIVASIRTAINTARTIIGIAWQVVRNLTVGAWNGIKGAVRSGIDGMMGFIRGLPGRIGAVLSGLGDLLVNAGRAIIQGLWDGMQAVWDDVTGWLGGLADLIPDWKGPMSKDRRILIPTGKVIMEGLGKGLESGLTTEVRPVLASATTSFGSDFMPTGSTSLVGAVGTSATLTINVYGDLDDRTLPKVEAALRRGVPTPHLDRRIRRLSGAR